jgi:hypothetical protein
VKRPPWVARDKRDSDAMHKWVNARLDELEAVDRQRLVGDADLDAPWTPPTIPPERAEWYDRWRREGGLEREAAEHGVIGPLKAFIARVAPGLEDFVRLRPLKPGEKYLRTFGVDPNDKRRDAKGRSIAALEAMQKGEGGRRREGRGAHPKDLGGGLPKAKTPSKRRAVSA